MTLSICANKWQILPWMCLTHTQTIYISSRSERQIQFSLLQEIKKINKQTNKNPHTYNFTIPQQAQPRESSVIIIIIIMITSSSDFLKLRSKGYGTEPPVQGCGTLQHAIIYTVLFIYKCTWQRCANRERKRVLGQRETSRVLIILS